MSISLVLAATGLVVGFSWGFRSPANYCHLGAEKAQALGNRFGSGTINGVIVGGIVWMLAYVVFGLG